MAASIFNAAGVKLKESHFIGYDNDLFESKVVQIIKDSKEIKDAAAGESVGLVLDKTPFYGESGGQVGDVGIIEVNGRDCRMKVQDTKKDDGSIIHLGAIAGTSNIKVGDKVSAKVDGSHRQGVMRA
ncbi:MAG TPA: alanine--tRNA ligase-related protein, partial [Candidatus Omnitrophota bacterium]|nr:alanine--tRNA ligase-related protein [Candidatus Omnitrophota bacterium]